MLIFTHLSGYLPTLAPHGKNSLVFTFVLSVMWRICVKMRGVPHRMMSPRIFFMLFPLIRNCFKFGKTAMQEGIL